MCINIKQNKNDKCLQTKMILGGTTVKTCICTNLFFNMVVNTPFAPKNETLKDSIL